MRIVFVGGNSGGHLFPLVAVWHEVQKLNPTAEAHFVCGEKAEDRAALEPEHCPMTQIPTPRMNLALPMTFLRGLKQAGNALDAFKPDIIFSKGGAVSVPVCWAAKRRKIPIILHESDAVMGRANFIISKWAATVCLGFPSRVPRDSLLVNRNSKQEQIPTNFESRISNNAVVTGNPVRPEITEGKRNEGLKLTGLSGKRPILLITGGSQGAQALNEWAVQHLEEILKHADVVHLTGKGKQGATSRNGYVSLPFAMQELPHLYAIANLAISRAGAGAISELAMNGIPTIVVPLRGLAQDHQEANALAAEQSGGCIRIEQAEMQKLLPQVLALLRDTEKRKAMSRAIHTLAAPEAARRIAEMLLR